MALAALVTLSASPARAQIETTDATGGNVGVGVAPQNGTRLRVQNASVSGFATTGIETGATGGTAARGLYGAASGASTNIGVYGTATVNAGQTAYGVYGTTDGSAGVGTSAYAGYFAGNVYVTGTVTELSDARFKVNVRPLGSIEGPEGETILDRVLALQPRAYAFTNEATYAHLNFSEGEQYGFLAQEVDDVFPDLVREGVHPPAEAGGEPLVYQAVNYVHLVPVLVQAMQEQQAEIDALEARLDQLEGGGE